MSAAHDIEWHSKRSRVVGGSEVAALYGVQQPYQMGLYALWHYKAGLIAPPEVEGERIDWGNDLETAIANVIARRKGWAIRKGGHVVDKECPGLGCTLDFEIVSVSRNGCWFPENPGALEIKNVDAMIYKQKWVDNEPPLHILLQLQHQLAATGYTWGAVGSLVGGNKLEIFEYQARPALMADIRRRVAAFWKSIDDNKPPAIDGSDSAFHALRELHPEPVDDAVCLDGDNEFPTLCAELTAATETRKEAVKSEDLLKARVMEKLGDHRRAWTDGWSASLSISDDNPGAAITAEMIGTIIGARKGSRRLTVKERTLK
jgi:predicted phage-related endonuclease